MRRAPCGLLLGIRNVLEDKAATTSWLAAIRLRVGSENSYQRNVFHEHNTA